MITAITFHAIDRLVERRKVKHLVRHLNKIRKWDLPADGVTEHNGYKYITRGGVLITVLCPKQVELKKFLEIEKGNNNGKE